MAAVKYSQVLGRKAAWKHPSVLARLPQCYYDYVQEMKKPATRVHDVPQKGDLLDYKLVDSDNLRMYAYYRMIYIVLMFVSSRERVADSPVDVIYPTETHESLWGGEGIVKGFTKHKDFYGKL